MKLDLATEQIQEHFLGEIDVILEAVLQEPFGATLASITNLSAIFTKFPKGLDNVEPYGRRLFS